MPRYPVRPRTEQHLRRLASPEQMGQPETLPWTIFDMSQNFVNASTTQLTFFQTIQGDKTLGNIESAGAMPDPQHLEIYWITVDFCFPALSSAAGVVGNLNDTLILDNAGRMLLQIVMSNKSMLEVPVRACHGGGGVIGAIGQTIAATGQQNTYNGVQDGGYWVGGEIVLPPKVNFQVILKVTAVQTLNTNNLPIRVGLHGVLHRRVL